MFLYFLRQVVGVDVASDAIDDARKNAQRNKIENAAYVAGPAEDLIPQMIGQATHEEIVAVIGQSWIQLQRKMFSWSFTFTFATQIECKINFATEVSMSMVAKSIGKVCSGLITKVQISTER